MGAWNYQVIPGDFYGEFYAQRTGINTSATFYKVSLAIAARFFDFSGTYQKERMSSKFPAGRAVIYNHTETKIVHSAVCQQIFFTAISGIYCKLDQGESFI